jgi:phage/plasmid-like protein (TIGR03299 family)
MSYTRKNPLSEGTLFADGTTTHDVRAIGARNYATGDRMPAFVGLAKHGGGFYAENTEGMTIERAMEAAHIDFNVVFGTSQTVVELAPVITADGVTPARTLTLDDAGWRSTVGVWPDGTARTLGKVRGKYQVCQQGEAAQFGQALIDKSGANIVAAGGYGNPIGQRTYMALRLPEEIQIGGQDPHDVYLTILNSFDGSNGLTAVIAPIRLACTNQTTMTFGRLAQRFQVRHTGTMADKLIAAREALDITFKWVDAWQEAMDKLLAAPMSDKEMAAFADKLLPTPNTIKTERGENLWADRRTQIVVNAREDDTNEFGRGTRYAAYQAVTYFVDHLGTGRPDARWSSLMDGHKHVEDVKERAASLLLAGL